MDKDFDSWNVRKKYLENSKRNVYCHAREIWWCSLGVNVGDEQDGRGKEFVRPVVVIKGFNQNIFFGVALTGKKRDGKYYFYLGQIDNRDSSAILSQVRLVDSKRLIRKISTLDEQKYTDLCERLKKVLF